jgi:hypothetical protein
MTQFIALLFSLIIEVPIVLLLLGQLYSLSFHLIVMLAFSATMLTHHLAWESHHTRTYVKPPFLRGVGGIGKV